MQIIAIILTFNEEKHLSRCIDSLKGVVDKIIVVDSFSNDNTVNIAKSAGAIVLQNKWVNHATQFNWALSEIDIDTKWVLRIDADEILSQKLRDQIKSDLPLIPTDVDGISFNRFMTFQGNLIRHGGVFPVQVLRLFRYGRGQSELRWMDEHIKVLGKVVNFSGELIDDNLNFLSWWIQKHNNYASLEAVDLLSYEFKLIVLESGAPTTENLKLIMKQQFKKYIYLMLPMGIRAMLYFLYRFIFCLGFLDGWSGVTFHFFQGFWYRFLVDAKIIEVKRYMKNNQVNVKYAIKEVLGINVEPQ